LCLISFDLLVKIEKDGGYYGQEGINYFFNFWGHRDI